MSLNSKAKGGRGEREWAAFCREHGFTEAHRSQQFKGGADSPDVVGLPGIHQEVKRVEKLNIYTAIKQAIRDSEGKRIPIVAHRRNRDEWLVTMRAEDWFKLYTDYCDSTIFDFEEE